MKRYISVNMHFFTKRYLLIFLLIILSIVSCKQKEDITMQFLEEGISTSNESISIMIERMLVDFQSAYAQNPIKIKEYYYKADSLHNSFKQIKTLIDSAITSSEYDFRVIVLNPTLKKAEYRDSLQNKLLAHRDLLIKLSPENETEIENQLDLTNLVKLEISISILNLYLNKVLCANHLVLSSLYSKIDKQDWKFDKYMPIVIPKSNRVRVGETFEAEIFWGALSTSSEQYAIIGYDTIRPTNGIIYYSIVPAKLGLHKYSGIVKHKSPSGVFIDFPINFEFNVIKK